MITGRLRRLVPAAAVALFVGCDGEPAPLEAVLDAADSRIAPDLIEAVRLLAAQREIGPLPGPPVVRPQLARLGQALAFDRLLSGNRDISCMTCHLPAAGTGDGRSLSIGQGASGLGMARVHPDDAFIPRNAPPLFNLTELATMFWDGRVSIDAAGTAHTPVGAALTADMTSVFEFGAVSALGMFPVLSREEMRAAGGNELAAIADSDPQEVWRALMRRLGAVPEYRAMFEQAYRGTPFDEMTFAHASNAIAAFLVSSFSFVDTPWDRFLRGSPTALTTEQLTGAHTFLSLRCVECHSGAALTDNGFHNVAVAQFGPGQGNGAGLTDDFGRMNVTGAVVDRYAFRTTPLRNVEITAPYGHDGAFFELREFIAHYSESDVKLHSFVVPWQEPLLQGTLVLNFEDILATRDPILDGVVLPDAIVDELLSFMTALTDPAVRNLTRVIPARVPSGLPIDR